MQLYIVSYKSDEETEIKYFLQIDNLFYLALSPMLKKSNSILKDINVRLPDAIHQLKNDNFFENFFYICEKTKEVFLMDIKNIQNKCIIYEKSNDLFYVTEYFNENEHD